MRIRFSPFFCLLFCLLSAGSPNLSANADLKNNGDSELIKIITGSAEHRIMTPMGVAVDSRDNIYVTDLEQGNVMIFNASGDFLRSFGKKGVKKGEFGLPWDIAIDSKDNVFVVDLALHRVQKFDSNYNFLWSIGSKGEDNSEFNTPFALALDQQDNLYILDTGNSRVQIFNNDGTFLNAFGDAGTAEGKFLKPSDLDIAPDGRIFVVDFDNSRIQIFSGKGNFIAKFGQAGSMLGDLAQPKGITIDQNGMVYVSDIATNYINVFDSNGDFLFRYGGFGVNPAQFSSPQKSCVDKEGKLYIADSQNNRVQVFIPIFHQGDYKTSECFTSNCHSQIKKDFEVDIKHSAVDSYTDCTLCHQLKNTLGILSLDRKKIEAVEVCIKCHADKTSHRYLHGPIGTGRCDDCHQYHGSNNKNMLMDKEEEVCFNCHSDRSFIKSNVHPPVKKGNCVKCHNPHGSEDRFFMQKETVDICIECHGQFKFPKDEYVHGPVAGGDCSACHDPHSSDNSYLLRKSGNALCFICHTESIIAKKNLHQPLTEDTAMEGCSVCHTPHQSKSKFQLRKSSVELCYTCHKNEDEFAREFKHGPLNKQNCEVCHDPHGSNESFLLKQSFPDERKNEFTDDLYALCFQCHLRGLVTEKITTDKTNFRRGTQNLHYVHVVQKERNCNLCHEVHTANNELMLREFAVYPKGPPSARNMTKFSFTTESHGGTCAQINCHSKVPAKISYSRLKNK